jgi:ABC-type branched-subunit amino acid transport system ATPase component
MAARGMVRTFQLTKSLTKLPVIENMKLGATGQKGEKWWNGAVPRHLEEAGGRDRGPCRPAAAAVQARSHA